MPSGTRTLWLVRHGKSAEGRLGQSDFDRPLNNRGLKNGSKMQDWYAKQPNPAKWVWTSPAARAKATAEFVAQGFAAELVEERSLYLASAGTILECLKATPDDVDSVALVAHNPGLTHFVNLLGRSAATDNLVTFGTARFETDADWPSLDFGSADLVDLRVPREL